MKVIAAVWMLAGLCLGTPAAAGNYYVNPEGDDAWSGTLKKPNAMRTDGPFKTLERAQQAIRTLKTTEAFNDKVTVNIAAGHYYLDEPLHFNLMDSGLPGREILWQGEAGGKTVLSAGLPVRCKKRDAVFWECPLAQPPRSSAFFDAWRIKGNAPKFELFVNGHKMHLARWPDQGWAHIKLPLDQSTQFSVMEPLPKISGDIRSAQVHIFAGNDWYDQYVGVEGADQSANVLKLSAPTAYHLAGGRRFYLQNLPVFLNAPGEWIDDPAAEKIVFIPPENVNPTEVVVSSLPNILLVDGAHYLAFENIRLQYSTATAVTIKGSSHITLNRLEIDNIGGKGAEIKNGSDVRLSNSRIHHTGAHGVVVSGGEAKTLKAAGHLISGNHIHDTGTTILTYAPGIEINGVGVTVAHNLLEQGAGTAILLTGNNHLIEKNEMHHFCLQASDCGAVYSGRNWAWRGNVIRYNHIHDIIGYGMKSVDLTKHQTMYGTGGARGIYLDDGVSGFEVSGNIFENPGFMAVQIGGGRDNKIVNNYIKTGEYAIWIDDRAAGYNWSINQKSLRDSPYQTAAWRDKYPQLARPMNHYQWPENNRIERNIIVSTKPNGLAFRYFIPANSTVIADNMVSSPTGSVTVDYKLLESNASVGGASWTQWLAKGVEKGSVAADPCVTIRGNILTTCRRSPAKDIGFNALPADIGLNGQ